MSVNSIKLRMALGWLIMRRPNTFHIRYPLVLKNRSALVEPKVEFGDFFCAVARSNILIVQSTE